jgi:hypothetical protein
VAGKGRLQWNKHVRGESLTRKEAILAKCYDCNGMEEGGVDCDVPDCALYAYFPYRRKHISKSGTFKGKSDKE